jgi:hypothetical protein
MLRTGKVPVGKKIKTRHRHRRPVRGDNLTPKDYKVDYASACDSPSNHQDTSAWAHQGTVQCGKKLHCTILVIPSSSPYFSSFTTKDYALA